MSAAALGNKELVELFLHRGVNIQVKNIRGRTALIWAEQKGHTEITGIIKDTPQIGEIETY